MLKSILEKMFEIKNVLTIIIFIIIFSQGVYAIGLTVPTQNKYYFTPNLEFSVPYRILNNGADQYITIRLEGDLKQYVSLSTTKVWVAHGNGADVVLSMKLPGELEPGAHGVSIIATEGDVDSQAGIVVAKTAVRGNIHVYVPYPDDYVAVSTRQLIMAKGNPCNFTTTVQNLGSSDNTVFFNVRVLDSNNVTILNRKPSLGAVFQSKETHQDVVLDVDDCRNLESSVYKVITEYTFADQKKSSESELRIGSFDIRILNYTKELKAGMINKVTVTLKSMWNEPITDVHFKLSLMDVYGREVKYTESALFNINSWEVLDKQVFIDAPTDSGEYSAKLEVYYVENGVPKLVVKDFAVQVGNGVLQNMVGFAKENSGNMMTGILILLIMVLVWIIYSRRPKARKTKKKK